MSIFATLLLFCIIPVVVSQAESPLPLVVTSSNREAQISYLNSSGAAVLLYKVPGQLISAQVPNAERHLLLVQDAAGATSIVQYSRNTGAVTRLIDKAFAPLGVSADNDGLLNLVATQSFEQPALALFNRFGSFQRVVIRGRGVLGSPRLSRDGSTFSLTRFETVLPTVWRGELVDPASATNVMPDDASPCLDSQFTKDGSLAVLCRENASGFAVWNINGATRKKLWSRRLVSAPVISSCGRYVGFRLDGNSLHVEDMAPLAERTQNRVYHTPLRLIALIEK